MRIMIITILAFALLALACGTAQQPDVARADQQTIPVPALDPGKFYPVKAFPKYSKEEDEKIRVLRCSDYFYVTFHGEEGTKIMFSMAIADSVGAVNMFAQRNIKLERDDTLKEPQARVDTAQSPPVTLRMSKQAYDLSPCLQIDMDSIWKEKKPHSGLPAPVGSA